jgi:O-acetyl-ADP-ribose deacetylase (regulator of RNase III)
LKKIVSGSLEQANETDNVQSITFPALGRGAKKFPAKILAKMMFQCVTEYEESLGTEPTLKDVRFVIYPTDEDSIKVMVFFWIYRVLIHTRDLQRVLIDTRILLGDIDCH